MLPIAFRSLLVFLFDLFAAFVAWVGGFLLRFNFEWPVGYVNQILFGLPLLLVVHTVACRWAGLYRGMWVFASLPDLKRVLKAVAVSALALLIVAQLVPPNFSVPRSLFLLYPLLLLLFMGGGRAAWRMWKEHRLYGGLIAQGKPVVLVGAGSRAASLVRELERSPDWKVVALVDDNRNKWGRELGGHPVVGSLDSLPTVLEEFKARHIILAMPSAAPEVRRRVTQLAVHSGAQVFVLPEVDDLMSGRVAISQMRPVEIEDLLGRDPVHIDTAHVSTMLNGRTVLVTGAGGSIGSELCHQLVRFAPSQVVLVETSEFALYVIEQWFTQHRPDIRIVALAGDVKDAHRMDEIFTLYRPQVVFHAAAYKHVPLMEVGNAWQAVRNNVGGTLVVARCAQKYEAERFVLISTDKAVNPTNVMGATKRLAEMVCEAFHVCKGPTRFGMVRFGNVLGSTGSVIPKFQEQIQRGGPVTVTHPDITRYFMSIPEAAQLVLQAASMGQGGEVYVLDMGYPVKIVDLARNMIRLSGYDEEQIRIEFTGLRPGEKLYEELLADCEQTGPTPHTKLRIARSREVPPDFLLELTTWLDNESGASDEAVRTGLLRWVPEYTPRIADAAIQDAPAKTAHVAGVL
ncbi:nucleoside-diphosphate sugar epimerase/dehydratase [Achromobacter seleniivolatilans]|uniref:Nucleoside-diphosphate sugar epimerase/dehydratase n=1 Tax=Achromobacter seleniivolatilans TaxID=3047478 RepID=A0ABY9M0J1_9BURK|nr:nucleoside-diphosphate sugar epimerase/dehydratase [Achromobacter sp. R39]WMD19382.1 nucleoside-diphosphate sugar epimerase/dehydratase [Achromobacter sp. R39]